MTPEATPIAASRAALAALALCTLLPSLGTSIANVGLPTLAAHFDASFEAVQWVVLAYLLANTTLVVGAGRLGDLLGRRRLLLAGTALFCAASVACGAAPGLGGLVAARAVQGLGAAAMTALAMAFVAGTVPKAQVGRAMGLLGTMSAVGTALGPSLGGALVGWLGWRAMFLVNLLPGLAAMAFIALGLPPDKPTAKKQGFDVAGTTLLAGTLSAYALAMTVARGRPALEIGLLAAASAGLALFVRTERRAAAPLVRLDRLREPALGASLATSALVATVMMSTLVVGPFHLAGALGLGAAWVGATMSVGPVVSAFSGMPAGRLVDRLGAHRLMRAGLAAMAAGSLALAGVPTAWGVPGYLVPLVVLTLGYALFQAANNTAVMAEVPADQRGVVSGLLSLARSLGLVSGASLMGAVFSHAAGPAAQAQDVARGTHASFAVSAGLMLLALALSASVRRR